MVFFSINLWAKASLEVIADLVAGGVHWPDEGTLKHFEKLLGPPLGYERLQPILRFFGKQEKQQARYWSRAALVRLGRDILPTVLSFVLAPLGMVAICAAARTLHVVANSEAAWAQSVVDTSRIKPKGQRAHRHFLLWKSARHIIGGQWQFMNVGLLMSSVFAVWGWIERCSPFTTVMARSVLVSQSTVPFNLTMRFDIRDLTGDVSVGVANTREPTEILAALAGATTALRGPPPLEEVDVAFCYATAAAHEIAGKVMTFRCGLGMRIEGSGEVHKANACSLGPKQDHFAAVVIDQTTPPHGRVIPYWSRR